MSRTTLLSTLGLVLVFSQTAYPQSKITREWTTTNGEKRTCALYPPSASVNKLRFQDGGSMGIVGYSDMITDDLIVIYEAYPEQTESHITTALKPRVVELVDALDLEEVDRLGKKLPFMKLHITDALVEKLKDVDLKQIKVITNNFPDLRQVVLTVLKTRLESPTDEFLATGHSSDQGNSNVYIEAKIAAYMEIVQLYKELRNDVVAAVNAELRDTTKSRFWRDLKVLSNLMEALPETKLAVLDALLHSIKNPATTEKQQHKVFYDSYGMRFSEEEVTPYYGGYRTLRGHHPVTPREILVFENIDRARIEAIAIQWPAMKPKILEVLQEALGNTVLRWDWSELCELAKSFPDCRADVVSLVENDLLSPAPRFGDISHESLVNAFSELQEVIDKRVEIDLGETQKEYSADTLIDIARKNPAVQPAAEKRIRGQMENPTFNREYENLDRLAKVLSAFPNLSENVSKALGRMITGPIDAKENNGKPDIAIAQKIASQFPGQTSYVEAAYEVALNNAFLKWTNDELIALVTSLPNLEPKIAEVKCRGLKINDKYTIQNLLDDVQLFPSMKEHCEDDVLIYIKNPTTEVDLNSLMLVSWLFPNLAGQLDNEIDLAVNRLVDSRQHQYYNWYEGYYGRMMEYFHSLMKKYPDHKDVILRVIYARIDRILEHSDKTCVVEWVRQNDLPYDQHVAEALAQKKFGIVMKDPVVVAEENRKLEEENRKLEEKNRKEQEELDQIEENRKKEEQEAAAIAEAQQAEDELRQTLRYKIQEATIVVLRAYWLPISVYCAVILLLCYLSLVAKRGKPFWRFLLQIGLVLTIPFALRTLWRIATAGARKTKEKASQAAHAVSDAAHSAKEKASAAASAAAQKAGELKQKAGEAASAAKHKAGEAASAASDAARKGKERLASATESAGEIVGKRLHLKTKPAESQDNAYALEDGSGSGDSSDDTKSTS